jgi:broad specificity phosphatase PhoE
VNILLTTLLLTRHGHVEGINPERFRGRAELPLTELGVHQAQAVARRIAATWQPAAIYTSPMSRCIATGQEIARVCGADTTVLEELNDLDYGDWQGQTHEEVRAHSPDSFDLWHRAPHLHRFPGGESLQDLVARIAEALRFALRRHWSDTVVLVGHNSGNRALLLTLLDQPLSAYWRLAQDPCCINEAEIVDGRITVLRVNETAHLPPYFA